MQTNTRNNPPVRRLTRSLPFIGPAVALASMLVVAVIAASTVAMMMM